MLFLPTASASNAAAEVDDDNSGNYFLYHPVFSNALGKISACQRSPETEDVHKNIIGKSQWTAPFFCSCPCASRVCVVSIYIFGDPGVILVLALYTSYSPTVPLQLAVGMHIQ